MNESSPPPSGEPAPPLPPPADDLLPPRGWSLPETFAGVLAMVIIFLVATAPVTLIAGDSGSDANIGSSFALGASLLLAALVIATRRGSLEHALVALGLRRPRQPVFWLVVGGIAVYVATSLALALTFGPPDQEDVTERLGYDEGAISAVLTAMALIVVAPLAEEIFFRGFLFGGFRNAMSFWVAAILSAVIFGLLHFSTSDLQVMVQLSVLGVILAWLYERTGSLWVPIGVHAFNNAVAFIVLVTG